MSARRRVAGLFATVFVAIAVGVLGPMVANSGLASAAQPQLNSTGSSFAGVAISEWTGQFDELDGGNVNFTVQSSVFGLNEFCTRNVDFGATDISYATGQSQCSNSQVPYPFQYMPTVAGGLAFEYNLQGSNGVKIRESVKSVSVPLHSQLLRTVPTG